MRVGISPKILKRVKLGVIKINLTEFSASFLEVSERMLGKLEKQ